MHRLLNKLSFCYTALVLTVGFGVAFYSALKLTFMAENQQLAAMGLSLAYAIELRPELDPHAIEALKEQVRQIPGITNVELEQPIPNWNGPPNQSEDWQALWQTYLPPMLVAVSELPSQHYLRAPEIAQKIKNLEGVVDVVWDETGYAAQAGMVQNRAGKQIYLTVLFWLLMLAAVVGLMFSYPERLRRQQIMRLGYAGAGTYLGPEKIWLTLALWHAALAAGVYAFVFISARLFFPIPLNEVSWVGMGGLLFEGVFLSAALSASVCAVGWWLHSDPLDMGPGVRPARIGE